MRFGFWKIGLLALITMGCATNVIDKEALDRGACFISSTAANIESYNRELFAESMKDWGTIVKDDEEDRLTIYKTPPGQKNSNWKEQVVITFSLISSGELQSSTALDTTKTYLSELGASLIDSKTHVNNDYDVTCEMMVRPDCPFFWLQRLIHCDNVLISCQYKCRSSALKTLDKAKWVDILNRIKFSES